MKDATLFHELSTEPLPPVRKPTAIGRMTQEEINRELQKGWDFMLAGNVLSAHEVNKHLSRKYGI